MAIYHRGMPHRRGICRGCVSIHSKLSLQFLLTSASVFLPNYPINTSWLDPQEQADAQWWLIHDAGEADDARSSSIKEALALGFADKRSYLFNLLEHTSLLSQNFQYFFPTIVPTLGYGNIETLLITAPVCIGYLDIWQDGRSQLAYYLLDGTDPSQDALPEVANEFEVQAARFRYIL